MKTFLLLFLLMNFTSHASDGSRRHFCEPTRTNISCQLELALICGPGYIDGCLTNQTSTHRCVLRNEGASCDQDVIILCPIWFRDGCETGETSRHQCVPIEGPSCKSGEEFECPEGFEDRCNK